MIWSGPCGFDGREDEVFRRLHTVEIQETFDGTVTAERAKGWRAKSPSDFRFCLKAHRSISWEDGFSDTPRVAEGWAATRAVGEVLRAEVIAFQTPPTFGPSDSNRAALYRFFESVDRPFVVAIDLPRSWSTHVTERICEDLRLVHAVDPFEREPATYGLAYFRPRGTPADGGPYSEEDFVRLESICEEYDDAFALFDSASPVDDALRFSSILGKSSPRES